MHDEQPYTLDELLRIKHTYLPEAQGFFAEKMTTFGLMSRGEKFIIILTFAFMIVCGMATGGYILEQLGDAHEWQKVLATFGAIASGNAQKSIFLDPLTNLANMFGSITEGESLEGLLLIALTFLSGACTFMINYGLGTFGAKIFMVAVLGISGPPGWVALSFALFFALMNALLVLSGTLSDVKDRDKSKNIFQTICSSFMKRWVLSLFAIVIALAGLLMTFYSGADEVAQKFGGIVIAGLLLTFALWTEGCYAYRKLMDAFTNRQMPTWTFWGVWDSLCIIFNAITVGFIAAEGGERFAKMVLEDGNAAESNTQPSTGDKIATDAIRVTAGVFGGAVSYAYTTKSVEDEARDATKHTLITQFNTYHRTLSCAQQIRPQSNSSPSPVFA